MMHRMPPTGLAAPRRRLRDRLAERDGTVNRTLTNRHELTNLLLLVDDDLRETAVALGGIETFLADALKLLDSEQVSPAALVAVAGDAELMERIDTLSETLLSLRRRMALIADRLGPEDDG